jgi:Ni/Fe-hydrogenase 1 B-type cytochrome subunit
MSQTDVRAVPVFDAMLRIIHAWNGLAILGLIGTGLVAEDLGEGPMESMVWHWHIAIGYALIGGLAARLIWGLMGPATARFSDLWHPQEWLRALRTRVLPTPRAGHDPIASLVFIALYAMLAVLAVTGLVLTAAEYQMGPLAGWIGTSHELKELVGEPHEALNDLVIAFVALHFAALAFHALKGQPVASGMITGKITLADKKAG